MAEPTKTPAPAPAQFSFDVDKAIKHLDAIKEEQLKHAGEKNHNPFLWIANNIRPLEKRIQDGERSEALYNAIMAMKYAAPVVNPKLTPEEVAKMPVIEQPTNPLIKPQGIVLPDKK